MSYSKLFLGDDSIVYGGEGENDLFFALEEMIIEVVGIHYCRCSQKNNNSQVFILIHLQYL